MHNKHTAYLSLGSNIGDREQQLKDALQLLQKQDEVAVTKISSLYETEPVGYKDQDWFYNIAIALETSMAPQTLLKHCQDVELALKRERTIRWGPRSIDVDILLYDALQLQEENLIIPHPRLSERAFVLIPLMEIAPDMRLNGEKISEIINKLKNEKVKKIRWSV